MEGLRIVEDEKKAKVMAEAAEYATTRSRAEGISNEEKETWEYIAKEKAARAGEAYDYEKNLQKRQSFESTKITTNTGGGSDNKEKIEQEEASPEQVFEKINKDSIQEFIKSGKKTIDVLRWRENERLVPIINEEEIDKLIQGFNNLEKSVEEKNFSLLEKSLLNIEGALQNMGYAHKTASLEDESESLWELARGLNGIETTCIDLKSKIPYNISILLKVDRIIDKAQTRKSLVAQKAQLIEKYSESRW